MPPVPRLVRQSSVRETPWRNAMPALSPLEQWKDFNIWEEQCPPILFHCVQFLARCGLASEGVYRISADFGKVSELLQLSQQHPEQVVERIQSFGSGETHLVADFSLRWCQQYFQSLIPVSMQHSIHSALEQNPPDRMPKKTIQGYIYCLSPARFAALMIQLQLCQLLVHEYEHTKMDAENLGRCLGPIFLADEDEADVKVLMRKTPLNNAVIHMLIQEFPLMIQAIQGHSVRRSNSPARRSASQQSPSPPTSDERQGREREDDRADRRGQKSFRLKSRSRSRKRKDQQLHT